MAVIEQQTVIRSSCFHKIRHRLTAAEVFNLPDLWKSASVTLNKSVWVCDLQRGRPAEGLTFQVLLMCRASTTTVWEERPNPSPLCTNHFVLSSRVTLKSLHTWIAPESHPVFGPHILTGDRNTLRFSFMSLKAQNCSDDQIKWCFPVFVTAVYTERTFLKRVCLFTWLLNDSVHLPGSSTTRVGVSSAPPDKLWSYRASSGPTSSTGHNCTSLLYLMIKYKDIKAVDVNVCVNTTVMFCTVHLF